MKKLFVLLIVLLSIAALPASSDLGGGIGLSLDYFRYYDSSFEEVNANELVLSASGSNTFDANGVFGINYSLGYGFPFNELTNFKNVHMATAAMFNFKASSWLSLSLTAGLHNSILIFKDNATDQFGLEAGFSLLFYPISQMSIELSMGYIMPLVSFYKNVITPVALDQHIMLYGLTFSYVY